jgi:putative thioredoxin
MSYELKNFDEQVIARSAELPVLVDFWAPWCGPCKMLGPVLEEMAGRADGRWELVKVNTEDHPDVALNFEISGIPDVRLFIDGKVVDEFKGFRTEADIGKWLKPWLPSAREAELKSARELAKEGKLAEAIAAAGPVLDQESDNERLRMELAEWELRHSPADVSARLAPIGADSDHSDKASAMREIADFLVLAQGEGNEHFVAGVQALNRGDYAIWVDAWLTALEGNRKLLDAKLLEAGKAVFRFLGPRHPVAEENYRRFTFQLY